MKCKVCGAPCRILCTASEFHFQCANLGSSGLNGKLPKPACIMSTHEVNKAGLILAWRIYGPRLPYGGLLASDIVLCSYCGWYNECLFCANSYPPDNLKRVEQLRFKRETKIPKGSSAQAHSSDQGQAEALPSTGQSHT